MGKGDRKTRRGKVHKGTFGVTRLRKPKRKFFEPAVGIKTPKKESKSKEDTKPKAKSSNKKDTSEQPKKKTKKSVKTKADE